MSDEGGGRDGGYSPTKDRGRSRASHRPHGRCRSRSSSRSQSRVDDSVNNCEQQLREDRLRANRLLTRMVKAIQDARSNQYNEAVVSMKRAELDGLWARYQDTSAALLAYVDLDDAAAFVADDQENESIANIYHEGAEILKGRLESIRSARARPPAVKPSEIMLPKFSGKYTAWIGWRAQFVAKVKDSQLMAGEKIDLLLNALTGEARQCAGETEHRDETDFNRMWNKLEATYDNKYQIVTEHIGKLLDLPVLTTPAPELLRRIVDTVEQELRSLERFDYQTDAWDPLVAVIVLRKLDPTTIGIWEMDRDPCKPPSLKDVLPFIEKRILAIRNLKVMNVQASGSRAANESTVEHQQPSISHSKHNPFATKRSATGDDYGKRFRGVSNTGGHKRESTHSDPPMCRECKEPHFLWHCKVFKGWPLDNRVKKVAEWGLCPCCLVGQHLAATCLASGCKRCDMAKHNNMLCPRHLVFRVNMISANGRRKGPRSFVANIPK